MNLIGVKAIFIHEMDRFRRTLLQSLASPIITTSLYFIVFGTAIGSRIKEIDGIDYGSYIVPGMIMLTILTQALSNASFAIYFQKFSSTIFEIHAAPLSSFEIILGFCSAAAAKSVLIGSIITYFIFSILHSENQLITDNWVNRSLIAVLLLIYPLIDTLRVYILRAKSGNSPFLPDRRHLHHKLIDKGYSHVKASILISLLSISVLIFGFGVSFLIWEIDLSSILFEGVNITVTISIILAYMIFLYFKFFDLKISK